MYKAVIDTNVLVSALLSSKGNPAEVMSLFYFGKLQIFYTSEILGEYKRVLAYKRLNIAEKTQIGIINAFEAGGTLSDPPKPSTMLLPDESDRKFYDLAKTGGFILITGNRKHFPKDDPLVMTPAEFLQNIV